MNPDFSRGLGEAWAYVACITLGSFAGAMLGGSLVATLIGGTVGAFVASRMDH